jgi:hypothetical protein
MAEQIPPTMQHPTPPPQTPPLQATTTTTLDAGEMFKIRYKGKDIDLKVTKPELVALVQKGYDYENKRAEADRRIAEIQAERESERKQLDTMREFQTRMRTDPAFAEWVDRMWKGESPEQILASKQGSAGFPDAPPAQAPNGRQSRLEQELAEKVARLESRIDTFGQAQGRAERERQIGEVLQGDEFFRYRPEARQLAAKEIDELVSKEGMTVIDATLLARTNLQKILDETSTAERDRLAANARDFRTERAGGPPSTFALPEIPQGAKGKDLLSAASARLRARLQSIGKRAAEGPG